MNSDTDRAVSTALGYVLTLGITSILISGLLIAAGGVVDDRRDATVRNSLEVAGERLVTNLMAADRLANASATTAVTVDVDLPERVAGTGYVVSVAPGSSTVVLEADGPDVTVSVSYATSTPVAAASVRGGDLRITLNAGTLEVASA